ncbi:UBA domain-containing protein 7 [Lachnellula arida]|uniref:UBA domain-containing protein 7 n=1 Tax=Lachnellula arida TaxID=1316785 RepID=A0A8T9B7L6_9HELO|nr:UBA domain-containing protein 7 [Lachnellula arida]
MDDLNGLEWSASSSSNTTKAPSGTGNYYPTLRPTPPPQLSGRNTPLSSLASGAPKPSAFPASKSVNQDSFSNLVSFGSSKSNTLSLQEQQAKLLADKRKQEEEKKRQYETQFGSSQAWDGLGNRSTTSTPSITSRSATPATLPLPTSFARPAPPAKNGSNTANSADDDLFAAFNADTKVDNASFYPPPSIPSSGTNTPGFAGNTVDLSQPQAWEQPSGSLGGDTFGDDDDPFGLGQMKPPKSTPTPIATVDDDDFLGDLGKPVEEVRRPSPAMKKVAPDPEPLAESDDPWDKAVAELVDMGFSAEQSRRALTESGSGLDIQAAVGWILNDAHRQAKQKQTSRDPSRNNGPSNGDVSRDRPRRDNNPAWMREEGRDRSQPRREENPSPNSEMDLSKTAAAVGNNLFKTANSLWKTSQKKVQKAVADFQQDGDPSQPKWMREAAEREQEERKATAEGRPRREKPTPVDAAATDEALMLESGSRPPPRKAKAPEPRFPPSSSSSSRDQSSALSRPSERAAATPRWQQTASPDPRSRINKQAVEEQSAQAYVSPARRKKATPQPSQPTPEPDLLFSSGSSSQPKQAPSRPAARTTPIPSKPSTPIQTRPKAPPRNIPSVSPTALAKSHEHRQAGTTHFKRGDYASAHQSYSASLMSLPTSHPITIILLCNRALTSLKTGIPKSAVSNADTALTLIGPAQGHSEVIDLGNEKKEMREFFGKALMRKAEALEQMEKWRDAGEVWKLCVENGVGGSTAIQGRTRCEKALAPKSATPKPQPRPPAKSAMQDLNTNTNSAAVERLRKANIDAEKADDEKFALADKVEAKISTWRDGKRDNLRALLGSLDNVMWEGSAWKKVGMHELVQNNKVKINYMKAIGKCHPDKLPQNSTMETQMLAALIFATLNESWDKFKAQNGM